MKKHKRVGYNDKLDADLQITTEEKIAAQIFDSEPHSEEECAKLGRRILWDVLIKFRPDLFD